MFKYEKIEDDKGLPIKLIDFLLIEDSTPIEKHWHNSIELIIPIVGKAPLWINGQKKNIYPGEVYIINSQDIHGFEGTLHRPIDPYKGYALQINYEFLQQNFTNIDKIYFKQPDKEITQLLLRDIFMIENLYHIDSDYKNIKIKSCVMSLLFAMLEHLSIQRKDCVHHKSEKNKKRMTEIVKYIDNHYSEDLSVNYLADIFEISPGHLSRLFKENLNIGMKSYLTSVRLNHAIEDLIETDLPIIDIAYCHGFPSGKSFQKTFKNKYGCSLSHYRKNMRK